MDGGRWLLRPVCLARCTEVYGVYEVYGLNTKQVEVKVTGHCPSAVQRLRQWRRGRCATQRATADRWLWRSLVLKHMDFSELETIIVYFALKTLKSDMFFSNMLFDSFQALT